MRKKSLTVDEVKEFDKTCLKHVETEVKQVPPTLADIYQEMLPDDLTHKSELHEIKTFVKEALKPIKIVERVPLPDKETIECEKIDSRAEVTSFDKKELKHVETKETPMVPTLGNLRAELLPDVLPTRPELEKLQHFVRSYLRHVETKEKIVLPTIQDIIEEESKTMGSIKKFEKTKLRHIQSLEKNTLPDVSTIWSEIIPDYVPTKPEIKELVKFAYTDLKHVEPNVKYKMPTSEDIKQEATETRAEIKSFDKSCLKRIQTTTDAENQIEQCQKCERMPDYIPSKPELSALHKFVKGNLKHVDTIEKYFQPTKEDIELEKKGGNK